MHKPERKNSHKERIFSLPQNKIDFGYQKEHQDRVPKEQKMPLKRFDAPSLLTANKARESLKDIDGWQLTDNHKMIYREFISHGFMDAIDMIERIAHVAEDEKHHPDIHLTQYRNLRVSLTTHEVGGLSEKDFIVARKINDLSPNKAVAISQQLQDKEHVLVKPRQKLSLTPKKHDNKAKDAKTKKSLKRRN
jgi:4a-hydroxytetrahydrobiopterin dehydratase